MSEITEYAVLDGLAALLLYGPDHEPYNPEHDDLRDTARRLLSNLRDRYGAPVMVEVGEACGFGRCDVTGVYGERVAVRVLGGERHDG